MLRNTDTTSSSSKAANTRRFYARELRSALPHCQPKPRERLNHNFQSCQTSVIRSSSCSMQSCNNMWYFGAWTLIYGNTFQSGSWALPSNGSLGSNPNLIFKNIHASLQHTGIPRFGGLIFGPWKMKHNRMLSGWACNVTGSHLSWYAAFGLPRLWPLASGKMFLKWAHSVNSHGAPNGLVYVFFTYFLSFFVHEFCTCLKFWLWLQQLQRDWGTRRFGIITGCFRQLCSVF